jgi:drug/metabolite transporter (DMT)-like permease
MIATGSASTRHGLTLPRERVTGLLLATATAVISGLAVFVNATAVKAVPDAAVFTTLKNLVAVGILAVLATAVVRPADLRSISRPDRLALAVIGLVGGGVAFLLFFTGLAMASAPSAAFIHKTMFLWVAVMAGPFLAERLGLAPVVALGALLAGQILILPPLGITWGTGETMIAIATVIWAVEVVLAKWVLGRVRSPIVGVARLGIGLLVLVGFLVATGRIIGVGALETAGWMWVLITGGLLAGYVGTWMAALRRAPATEVTSILVLGALVTAALSALARGTVPELATGSGYMLVLLGVAALLVTRRTREATPAVALASGDAR